MFDLYPVPPAAAEGPRPELIDTVRRVEAAGRPLDPATGAAVVAAMDVEAALAQAESARLAPRVVDVAPLRRDAAQARAGR